MSRKVARFIYRDILYGDQDCSGICTDHTIPSITMRISVHYSSTVSRVGLSSGLALRNGRMHERLGVGPGVFCPEASPECSICATSLTDTTIESAGEPGPQSCRA